MRRKGLLEEDSQIVSQTGKQSGQVPSQRAKLHQYGPIEMTLLLLQAELLQAVFPRCPAILLAPTDATKVAANKLEIFANGDLDSLAGKSIGSADGSIGFGEASTTLDGCTGCAHGTITFNGGDLWYSGGWRAAQGAQVWP